MKDAVDKAKSDLPNNLPEDPSVIDINLSEMPILYVNISGDFDLKKLKDFADIMKDSGPPQYEIGGRAFKNLRLRRRKRHG